MVGTKTRLKFFIQIIIREMFLNLNCSTQINVKFEIGRKLSKLNASAPDFLSMGVIIADLKYGGTEPETSEA